MPRVPFGPEWQIRALIARHRYGNGVVRQLAAMLRAVYADVARDIATLPVGSDQRRQSESLLRLLAERLREVSGSAAALTRGAMTAAAQVESSTTRANANALRVALGLPPRTLLIQAARLADITAAVDIAGVGFADWWQQQAVSAVARARVAIQSGISRGLHPTEIARDIYSRHTGSRTAHRRHLAFWNTAVRTTMTAVQSQSSLAEFRDMPDVVESIEYQAVLDVRTSSICRALDGNIYALTDASAPAPPQHPNCRSALVPVVRGVPRLGRGQTYEQWLRRADADTQNAALGKGRAELYRRGNITLAEMVSRDGTTYTLAQLETALSADGRRQPTGRAATP